MMTYFMNWNESIIRNIIQNMKLVLFAPVGGEKYVLPATVDNEAAILIRVVHEGHGGQGRNNVVIMTIKEKV